MPFKITYSGIARGILSYCITLLITSVGLLMQMVFIHRVYYGEDGVYRELRHEYAEARITTPSYLAGNLKTIFIADS